SEVLKLRHAFLDTAAPTDIAETWKSLVASERRLEAYRESIPTVMVMEEMPSPKPTNLLLRGAYDRPGEVVPRAVPGALPPLPAEAPANRLGLAQWLVDPSNPLTARVAVNRYWQSQFGVGIVKTVEDFGSQGEWPSHPELLDWLATEFIRSGWDVKAMQKLIVTSATYRQSSKVRPELTSRDPENRLLARAPRLRLPAEAIRDSALLASGLLKEKIGGLSVKPYQPPGLWSELGDKDYEPGKGDDLYRRSLYTFWKRTAPPPFMSNFDSALREACTVRETRTNTPLQALNLMNDVTFLEASKMLATRVLTAEDKLGLLYQLVLSREPAESERALLTQSIARYRDHFQSKPQEAFKLLSQGASSVSTNNASEFAAWTMLASTVLNLDEAVTRE
ncbi:MAG TPA: DUF1553 domain-containing protein, partial [Bryobacteraceae bacterium]|nr:DUF1553 domain-containing protein [Bryobacteraceae bacterium]